MQSSLFKLGALMGVIGVGFLVLLKAQNDMTGPAAPPDEFNDVAAIDELGDLQQEPSSESAGHVALADTYGDEPTTEAAQPRDALRTSSARESGPQRSPAPAQTSASEHTAVGSTDDGENPFTAFGFDQPSVAAQSEPAEEETQSTEAATAPEGAGDGVNPFSTLVSSFTDKAADKLAEAETAVKSELHELEETGAQIEAEAATEATKIKDELVASADAFDPFSPVEDASPQATLADEPTATEPTLAEPSADTLVAATESVEEAESGEVEPTVDEDVISAPAPKQFEPTSLTALPPTGAGPALMGPPAQGDEPGLPSQVEPATFETAEADAESDNAIAQVSGEQPAGGASDPNPFLVFPGDPAPAPAANAPAPNAQDARPQFPSVEPRQSTGRAWIGDESPQIDSDHRVVLPDGTVEMTIQPRDQAEQSSEFNPFAAVPERAAQPQREQRRASQDEPAPFDVGQNEPSTSSPGRFPDPGLSFSEGPIQPSGAEMPSGTRNDALTPADFVGVGTISPDTPSTPQQAQLTIEKHAPPDAALGQELIYSILITNVGKSAARNVVVEDQVPKGSELQGTDPQAQMTQDKKLVWQLGAMAPGQKRTIRIKVVPTEAGQIGSVATVSFEAAVASRTVITAPDVRLDMKGPTEVRVGEKAPFKFTLTNNGTADAANVFLRNIVPPGFEHPAAERQPSGEIDIEYEVGTLTRGQSRDIELTLLAIGPGQFQNHAILTADGNVSVEAQQPVNVITSRVTVRREGPANRVVGSDAQFINTISNESSQMLTGVRITETIPQGVKFLQASDNGYFNPSQRTVMWQINTLEPGGRRRLQISLQAEEAGQFASLVTAVDQSGDKAEAKSNLRVTGFSSLTIDVDNPTRAIPVGQEVALRVKVRNGGTATANRVQTRIELPPQLRFVSARGPVRYAQEGSVIAFEPINEIGIQGEQSFDIVLAGASESSDARVVVQLESAELSKPLTEDESVVIYADRK